MDYCRPGLLYMGVTSDDEIPIVSQPDFIPILSWYANISLVKWIHKGQTVSYGRHFTAAKDTKVATVSVGYADGLHRLVSNQGLEVLVHGQRCPIIGNICMDQCMIDVTGLPVHIDQTVEIIGKHQSVVALSDGLTTHFLELLCNIDTRVPSILV